jgi:hypothetical protein
MSSRDSALALALLLAASPALAAGKSSSAKLEPADAARDKIIEESRKLFVRVGLAPKPYDSSEAIPEKEYYEYDEPRFGSELSDGSLAKRGQRAWSFGVLTDRDGTFVLDGFGTDWRHIDSIVAIGADGVERPARPIGIAKHGRMVWLRADGLGKDAPDLEKKQLFPGDSYHYASARLDEGRPALSVGFGKLVDTVWLDPAMKVRRLSDLSFRSSTGFDPEPVFTSSGAWIGVHPMRLSVDSDGSWPVHPSVLAADRLPWKDFQDALGAAAAKAEAGLTSVHLRFRQIKAEKSEFSFSKSDANDALKERNDVGLPLPNHLVLVPVDLDKDLVQRLESVTIDGPGGSAEAKFVGVLKEYGGYLLEASAAPPDLAVRAPDSMPQDLETFLAVDVRFGGGRIETRAHPQYFDGVQRGYGDRPQPRTAVKCQPGTLLAGLDGRPFAIALNERLLETERQDSLFELHAFGVPESSARVVPMSELVKYFSDPSRRIDTLVMPRSIEEAKRRVWLGVETQDVTPDIAQALHIERETRDGTRGQLVTFIYRDSPAAKLGVATGDVLLKLHDLSKKDDVAIPAAFDVRAWPSAADAWWRDWFVRDTPLTRTLAKFIPGTPVELTFAHGHAEKTVSLTLKEGPPDFESAPKLRDEATGLTLKELTYDVREAMNLGSGGEGVLVCDLESGSPADVAGLAPIELVQEIDGNPVKDLESYSRVVKAAVETGKTSLRMRVGLLNSRYVDVNLAARDLGPEQAGSEDEAPPEEGDIEPQPGP